MSAETLFLTITFGSWVGACIQWWLALRRSRTALAELAAARMQNSIIKMAFDRARAELHRMASMMDHERTTEVQDRIRAAMMLRLDRSLARLSELRSGQAGDSIVASELDLIGRIGMMLSPMGVTHHMRRDADMLARRYSGLCVAPDCSNTSTDHEMCSECRAQVDSIIHGAGCDVPVVLS